MPMDDLPPCPTCASVYTYPDGALLMCPEFGHEWSPEATEETEAQQEDVVRDANGNGLQNGDDVLVIKDLPVKGAPKPVKAGTKVKNIRLVDADHDIACKIDGFGAMALKSQFVRKA